MTYFNDQAERSAAAGRSRLVAGTVSPAVASAPVASWGHGWTMPSTVIPTTKRHAINPAPRPEEAASP